MVAGPQDKTEVTKKALEDLKKRASDAANLEKEKNAAVKQAKTQACRVETLAEGYKSIQEENQKIAEELRKLKESQATALSSPTAGTTND